MRRVLPFAVADSIAGARERRDEGAGRLTPREAAGMIEMEMRGEHEIDVLTCEAFARQRDVEALASIDAEDVDPLRVHEVTDAGVDEQRDAPRAPAAAASPE